MPTGLLIDGQWRFTDRTLDVFNPANDQSLASIADATVADALDAVSAAHTASDRWAAAAPRTRAEVLRKAFEIMTAEIDDAPD